MKKFIHSKNHDNRTPERRTDIRVRTLAGLGGAAVSGAAMIYRRSQEVLSVRRDSAGLFVLVGGAVMLLAIASEVTARVPKPKNDEDGGGYWDKDDPESPLLPTGPEADGITLIDEIEMFLAEQEPVSV